MKRIKSGNKCKTVPPGETTARNNSANRAALAVASGCYCVLLCIRLVRKLQFRQNRGIVIASI